MIDLQLPTIPKYCPQEIRREIAKIASIFETNAFNMMSTTEGEISGIFPCASRINHSCSPNAIQIWNSRIESLTIHAIKDIPIDEEITISYVSTMLDRDQRQPALQYYGFLCTCAACDDTTTPSSAYERRQQIYRSSRDLESFLSRYFKSASSECLIDRSEIEQPFNAIRELIDLMLAEGLVGAELSRWYDYDFHYSRLIDPSNVEGSLDLLRKAQDTDLYVKGDDHEDVGKRSDLINGMELLKAVQAHKSG